MRKTILSWIIAVVLASLMVSFLPNASADDGQGLPIVPPAEEPAPLCGSFFASLGAACVDSGVKIVDDWFCPDLSEGRLAGERSPLELTYEYGISQPMLQWYHWCEPVSYVPGVPNPQPSEPLPTPTPSPTFFEVLDSSDELAFTGVGSGPLGYLGAGLLGVGAFAAGLARRATGRKNWG